MMRKNLQLEGVGIALKSVVTAPLKLSDIGL